MNAPRIPNYRILDKIGEGGMGEVYRAEDTRLGRQVAVKVLPEHLASDPDRMARLQREARVLASLNHPNIASIHGIEDMDAGGRALILELVEVSRGYGYDASEDRFLMVQSMTPAHAPTMTLIRNWSAELEEN